MTDSSRMGIWQYDEDRQAHMAAFSKLSHCTTPDKPVKYVPEVIERDGK